MKRTLALLLAFALIAAACGGDDAEDGAGATTTTMADDMSGGDMNMGDGDTHDMDDMGHDMDDGDMGHDMHGMHNMGDPTATPAEDVEGAELVEGSFAVLETRPAGYDDVTGTAVLARHDGGTTVTIRLEGLKPDVAFISHVHVGTCDELGGDHYRFDPDGSDMPPNEIHLAFDSGSDGSGFMTAENDQTVDEQAVSVVVHPLELLDNKIACAEFDG